MPLLLFTQRVGSRKRCAMYIERGDWAKKSKDMDIFKAELSTRTIFSGSGACFLSPDVAIVINKLSHEHP